MTAAELQGIAVYEGKVAPEWIDLNGHMNVAYYVLAFDMGTDALWGRFGITEEFIAESNGSTFAVDCHVTYQRELLEGDEFIVTTQILAYDHKRIHQFQRMFHARESFLVATAEWLNLFVDLNVRRVSQWPESILANIESIAKAQSSDGYSETIGQQISIAEPLYRLPNEVTDREE